MSVAASGCAVTEDARGSAAEVGPGSLVAWPEAIAVAAAAGDQPLSTSLRMIERAAIAASSYAGNGLAREVTTPYRRSQARRDATGTPLLLEASLIVYMVCPG